MSARHVSTSLIATVFFVLLIILPARAQPGDDDVLGGQLRAVVNGHEIQLPLMHSDISATVEGDLATVTVVQTFENPTQTPLNATYLFPLQEDAAVYAMNMQVGDETVTAQIREREQARQEFRRAQQEGRAAALLTQHRPNMFTQEVANLMPGMPVRVTLRYAQTVPRKDGAYELVMPLVVGPRYNPAPRTVVASNDAQAPLHHGQWNIAPPPAYPEVAGLTIPDTIGNDRVSTAVDLSAGMQIGDVTSATHQIAVTNEGDRRHVALASGRTIDNRDFVLRYRLSGNAVQAGVTTHSDQRGGFFSVVIEPPAAPTAQQIAARAIVFVLDTSGSMEGEPIEASKAFMQRALQTLRPTDYFRIVQFNSTPREFSAGPVPANAENIANGQRFVQSLYATGGTEVVPAIQQAFAVRQQPNTLRLVVFLTDGYIGNEAEVLSLLSGQIRDARVYAFGVGSGVNRYLLEEMARRGRGFARFVDPTETSHRAAIELAERLEAPVLTDISIDWGTLNPQGVTPAIIPDLFAGDSLRLMGRFTGARDGTITVTGKINGRVARLPVRVHLAEGAGQGNASAIPVIWARSQVGDLMRDYTTPTDLRTLNLSDSDLQSRVTHLGLDFALVTQWTSFVAVSQRVVNAHPDQSRDANVPLPMVEGVGPSAYGVETQGAMFGGAAAPEPQTWALLALLLALLVAANWRGLRMRTKRVR